ncbi:MAG TPA: universal stress protein [Stellaceae bacterium]|nr:universal stress protein [Stellaceae bacterium]
MAYKDILVLFDGGRGQDTRLRLAAELARRHQGYLTGLYAMELAAAPITTSALGSYAEAEAVRSALATAREAASELKAAAESRFREALQRAAIQGEWRVLEGSTVDLATLHARYADIAVLGQVDPDNPLANAPTLPESVLMGAGRPVLIVPYVGHFATLGKNVLVAWNATREAARATGDALPLLTEAKTVTVLSFDPPGDIDTGGRLPASHLVEHLRRHGIAAVASTLPLGEVGVGDQILSRAADLGCDLIVMGGYGHSRTRELIFGGASRSLLQHMTVPVLMAH